MSPQPGQPVSPGSISRRTATVLTRLLTPVSRCLPENCTRAQVLVPEESVLVAVVTAGGEQFEFQVDDEQIVSLVESLAEGAEYYDVEDTEYGPEAAARHLTVLFTEVLFPPIRFSAGSFGLDEAEGRFVPIGR